MDFNAVLQAVSTLGFPIVMCLLMFKRQEKSDEKHSEEIKELSTAIQNNTMVMNKLVDKLDG